MRIIPIVVFNYSSGRAVTLLAGKFGMNSVHLSVSYLYSLLVEQPYLDVHQPYLNVVGTVIPSSGNKIAPHRNPHL